MKKLKKKIRFKKKLQDLIFNPTSKEDKIAEKAIAKLILVHFNLNLIEKNINVKKKFKKIEFLIFEKIELNNNFNF